MISQVLQNFIFHVVWLIFKIGSSSTETSTLENTINLLKELLEIWNLYNQRLNTSSSGKPWSNTLAITFKLVNQLMWRNSDPSLTTCRLSFLKSHRGILAQRLIFSHRDKREKIFITLNQFLSLILSFNTILLDTQERKKFPLRSVSTLFIKKDSELFMPTLSQLLLPHALESMLSMMHLIHFSWLSKIWSNTTKTLTLLSVSVMWEWSIENSTLFLGMISTNKLEVHNLKTLWLDKNLQFQLSGELHMDNLGQIQLWEVSSRNQILPWPKHWMKRLQPSKSCP